MGAEHTQCVAPPVWGALLPVLWPSGRVTPQCQGCPRLYPVAALPTGVQPSPHHMSTVELQLSGHWSFTQRLDACCYLITGLLAVLEGESELQGCSSRAVADVQGWCLCSSSQIRELCQWEGLRFSCLGLSAVHPIMLKKKPSMALPMRRWRQQPCFAFCRLTVADFRVHGPLPASLCLTCSNTISCANAELVMAFEMCRLENLLTRG